MFQWKGEMAIAVDAELMSALVDLRDQMRILLGMLSDQKERSVDVVLRQHLQYLRRVLRVRTVIEGQRDLAT